MPISNLYYPGIGDNKDITDVFDFDNFANHVQLARITKGTNMNVKSLIQALTGGFTARANSSATTYMDVFGSILFQQSFTNSFYPTIAAQNPALLKASDVGQAQYMQIKIENIITSKKVDLSDMSKLQAQMLSLPDSLFTFGQQFVAFGQTFDAATFKKSVVSMIMDSFYTYLYYAHIVSKIKSCQDFKCKRAYLLTSYVYVYYTLMTLFLHVFADAATVQQFSKDTQMDNAALEKMKYDIIVVMDSILSRLQDENLLDVPGMQNISTMASYYGKLQKLSTDNVNKSKQLNNQKNTALLMQNNLGNYTNNEVQAFEDLRMTKIYLIVLSVVMVSIFVSLLGLAVTRNFMTLNIVAGIVLLGLAINGLTSVVRNR
jgi:hypothetical protein